MMKKIRFSAAFLVLVVVALSLPLLASADHSWSKYHWDISNADSVVSPLVLGNNTSDDWTTSLSVASSDWNQSVLNNAIGAGGNAACDPTIGAVEVCNSAYGENGWLGIAQVWVYRGRDGHIAQALVKVNDTYFAMEKYDSDAWRDYVMCQEVGHTFGLGHQDENFDNGNLGTCMDYTSDPDGTLADPDQIDNLHPNAHDYALMTEKYGHLNPTSDGGSDGGKPDKGNNGGGKGKNREAPGNDISQWGQSISTDGKGRPDLFELNLGGGDKLFTHVLWAN